MARMWIKVLFLLCTCLVKIDNIGIKINIKYSFFLTQGCGNKNKTYEWYFILIHTQKKLFISLSLFQSL
jgi:hypothetical protein